ncbi:D-isomer specific 2-hydroxyacid dehydrogenase [Naematelia encephala]|uniref:D-isomer specific 2-hydroxyacid dehydrogenase n=1 Tax=Naematelia encephala TaxID=71784 RepID=A0A1Y2AGF7_9TREE|nr:D-isomer specific 2-hydroxyacid dehydrogenase [Naematelia encephala]
MTAQKFSTLAVCANISKSKLDELKKEFHTVHYHPDAKIPDEILKDIDIWFTRYLGFPANVKSLEQIPKTRLLQLTSAGANVALTNPVLHEKGAHNQISVCSASGIHTMSIPQYIIAQIVNLYMKHQIQFHLCRTNAHWPTRQDIQQDLPASGTNLSSLPLYGKTAGLLGYGHIARETARLLKAFNVTVIAANSNGSKRVDDGYIIPGTGDIDGSIPSAYYSTNDKASFKEFLSKSDILIASLPSTPQTQWLLKKEHFEHLPKGAVFINVGRGNLAKSEDIIAALDSPYGLEGAALDVTDPEPLPDGHPLFTHPKVIITPHTSGDFVGSFDAGADVLLAQVRRLRAGQPLMNLVDPQKGY